MFLAFRLYAYPGILVSLARCKPLRADILLLCNVFDKLSLKKTVFDLDFPNHKRIRHK